PTCSRSGRRHPDATTPVRKGTRKSRSRGRKPALPHDLFRAVLTVPRHVVAPASTKQLLAPPKQHLTPPATKQVPTPTAIPTIAITRANRAAKRAPTFSPAS